MPSYNVAAALLTFVGILGGAAYRAKPRAWILFVIGALATVNLILTPFVAGKVAFGLGLVWIVWVYRKNDAVRTDGPNT